MTVPVLMLDSKKKAALDAGFYETFTGLPERYFSAPGRTEISGNHTDHQGGCVLAGAVNLDTLAAVRLNGTNTIRVHSKGYPLCEVCLDELEPKKSEVNTTPALIRGVAARFSQMGCKLEGFDAYCESTVLPGSGLSSSASFEVLIGTIINCLFFGKKLSAIEIASNPAYGYIKQKTRRLCLQSPSFFSSAARMGTGTIRAQRMPGDTVRAGAAIFTRSGCGPVRISFWQRYSCAGYP